MKWWTIVIGFALLIVLGFLVFRVYPSTTGRFIFWQNSDFSDPANPNPHLSPIPTQSPLTDIPSVTVNCDNAKKARDLACNLFSDKYFEGCKWYHFSWIFDCKDLRTSCSNAQDNVSSECRS